MRKIRIGNDIVVQWSLVAKGTGEPFVVEGKDIRLSLKSIFATQEIEDFTAQGNTIAWTFKGAEQKQTGIYSLVVSVVDAQGAMVTTDVCKFVELVACSCEAAGADEAGVHTESIDLVSNVEIGGGVSITPDWNASEGEEGFIKNRTHYLEAKSYTNVESESEEDYESGMMRHTYRFEASPPSDETKVAIKIKVGVDYIKHLILNTFDHITGEGTDTLSVKVGNVVFDVQQWEEEITLRTLLGTTDEIPQVSYAYIYEKQCKQMDDIFIPDTIARKSYVDIINHNLGEVNAQAAGALEMALQHEEQLTKLSVGKADKNGKYADLTAGDLYGHGESVPAEFSFRASGGKSIKDGTAYIKELQGNAVVWNQMLKKGRTLFTGNGVEVTKNGDGSYTLNGTPTQDAWILIEEEVSNTIPLSHVWLLIGCPNGGSESTYCLWDSQNAIQDVGAGQIKRIDKNSLSIRIMVRKDFECVNLIFRPRLIDLTKMFGQGNEPTTIEDFYRLLPSNIDLNAYNEGEVIPFTADGIKSVGDNAWDEEWENGTFNTTTGNKINTETTNKQIRSANPIPVVEGENYCSTKDMWVIYETSDHSIVQSPQGAGSGNSVYVTAGMKFKIPTNAAYMRFYLLASYGTTYNHDITISLYHSGWKAEVDNTYKPYWEDTLLLDSRIKEAFPNGMMPWDKVYNKDGKGYIVKGSGSVDMGDMEWVYNETFGGFVSKPQAAMQNWKGVCSKYHYAGGYATVEDKEFGYIYLDQCIVKDTSYTDAATFKADMAGTMLYYELAEPTILEYDTPFQLDYKVADFGTEEIISSEPSAPFKGRTIYQFNAVDQIRENYNEIEKIKAALAKAGITLDL